MRFIETHKTNGANNELDVVALDAAGPGGANHEYEISPKQTAGFGVKISFQNGPIREVGVNGLTNEALLAVLIDRMEGFQSGNFACEANQKALDGLNEAMQHLTARTRDRLKRGVEGVNAA